MRVDHSWIEGLGPEGEQGGSGPVELARALECMGGAVFLTDTQGRLSFVNRAWEEMLGYARQEILGQLMTVFAPSDATVHSDWTQIIRGGLDYGWNGEIKHVRRNGEEIDVHLTLDPVTGPRGEVAGLVGLAQDITDRKRADEELRRISEFNDRVMASIPTARAVLRGNQHVVDSVNRAFCQLLDVAEDSVEGKPVMEVLGFDELDGVIQEALLDRDRATRHEIQYSSPDGKKRWFDVSVTPMDPDDDTLLIINDVTDRRETEERLLETARLVSVGELAAGVAHELNNPLAGVLGFAQLLMAGELSPSIRVDIRRIYEQAERANKVVQNLLSFARKRQPERKYIDLTTTIARAVALKVYDFSVSNIHLSFDLPTDFPHTMADDHQLQQVFLNILLNGEQAMVEAKGRGTLHIKARHTGDRIRLSFADDGPGIAPDQVKKIFDPFFSTKGVGRGTGLGLSICYGIIQEHGGRIWVESQLGEGATFHVELPVLPPEEGPECGKHVATLVPPQSILVVDDETVVRDLLFQVLSGDGHAVDLASNGEEGWASIRSKRYGCIIMDLRMPGISGQQLYQQTRSYDADLARHIIFITGDTARPEVRDFLEETGNPVIGKPFDLEELRWQIQRITSSE